MRAFAAATAGLAGARSIANSAALIAWPDTRSDWVRPGLVLYGVSPFPDGTGAGLGLRPAMTLRSEVIAVKDVAAGETVGYGGAWRARAGDAHGRGRGRLRRRLSAQRRRPARRCWSTASARR